MSSDNNTPRLALIQDSPIMLTRPVKGAKHYLYAMSGELLLMEVPLQNQTMQPFITITHEHVFCSDFRAFGHKSVRCIDNTYALIYLASVQGVNDDNYMIPEIFTTPDIQINRLLTSYRACFTLKLVSQKDDPIRIFLYNNKLFASSASNPVKEEKELDKFTLAHIINGVIHINHCVVNSHKDRRQVHIGIPFKLTLLESVSNWRLI